ncbi:hypothetical protein BDQ17DRAFT_1330386 [Cyathus striatus]|nr:hypothetical protein BDQ17DRAFT_1330386 [Cyathus striatus]
MAKRTTHRHTTLPEELRFTFEKLVKLLNFSKAFNGTHSMYQFYGNGSSYQRWSIFVLFIGGELKQYYWTVPSNTNIIEGIHAHDNRVTAASHSVLQAILLHLPLNIDLLCKEKGKPIHRANRPSWKKMQRKAKNYLQLEAHRN